MVGRASVYRWLAAAREEGRRAPKPMHGGPQPIIRAAVAAALHRLLDENNPLSLVECRDRCRPLDRRAGAAVAGLAVKEAQHSTR